MWATGFSGNTTDKNRAFPTVLGDARFLNVLFPKDKEDSASKDCYFFYRYEIAKNGTLTLWAMNEELFSDAIRSGEIQGKITNENGKEEKILTDTSKNLSRFIEKHGAEKAFSEKFEEQTYHRLSPAPATAETPKNNHK